LVIHWSFGFGHWEFIGGGLPMSNSAHVESIDALKHFRVALIKFAEAAGSALADAEAEMQGMMRWLEHEQLSHWQTQIRKRHDLLERAKEALRMKRLFRDSSGRTPHAIEEEKAVRLAQVRVEEAEQKLLNVKKYTRVLQKELDVYKGAVQKVTVTVESELPVAATMLNGYVTTLENYVMLAPADTQAPAAPPAEPSTDQQQGS
jgi:hypothetical protein